MTRSELITLAAKTASEILLSIHPGATPEVKEGHLNFVTLADKKSEEAIVSLINQYYPEDSILSEETHAAFTAEAIRANPHVWIIDPLDGTADYQYKRNHASVAIAYAENGILQAGVVQNPFSDDVYRAEYGSGAFWNDSKIHVAEKNVINDATIYTGNCYEPDGLRSHLTDFLKISPSPWLQIKGSAALEICEIASGQGDMFFSYHIKPWDCAAAFCILLEAGGVIKNRRGENTDFLSPEVIIGNQTLVDSFINTVTTP
jgi:myo-inositol-1(or 4)-monophosphatase